MRGGAGGVLMLMSLQPHEDACSHDGVHKQKPASPLKDTGVTHNQKRTKIQTREKSEFLAMQAYLIFVAFLFKNNERCSLQGVLSGNVMFSKIACACMILRQQKL